MIRKKGRIIPLKIKLIITFSIMVIISLLIQVGISYFFFYDVIENKTTEYFRQTITQANRRIDASLFSYEKMTRNIIANEEIQKDLRDLQQGTLDLSEASYRIKQELAQITLSEVNINSIQIIPKGNRTINYTFASNYADYDAIKKMPWFDKVNDLTGQLLWLPSIESNKVMIGKIKTFVFTAVRKINDLDTGQELGVLLLNIDEKHLRDVMNEVELGENGHVYLVGQDGVIISYKDENLIGEKLDLEQIDINKNMIITDISPESKWKIIGIVPNTEYTSEIERFSRTFFYLTIVAIGAIVIFAAAISASIVAPIKRIIFGMKEVQKGNLNIKITHKQNNELGVLADHFNQMTEELKFTIDKVYKQEISRRESELKMLQAQLNPHFLYNTLDTIYWMLIMKEEEEVGDLVVALAAILRYSISRGEEFVTIKKDTEQLINYLNIQKARFDEKLTFNIDIDESIKDYEIPKLLLQPLIENSISHGFKKMKVKGNIEIVGYKKDEQIIFEVIDNGVGISKERIREILGGTVSKDEKHTGLGIMAVDSRIKLLYGEEYGIEIDSIPGERTKITVRFNNREKSL